MISRKTIQDLVETIQAAHAQLYTNSGQPILVASANGGNVPVARNWGMLQLMQ